MVTATLIPNTLSSFVYEDLVSQVQNQMIQKEYILSHRYEAKGSI